MMQTIKNKWKDTYTQFHIKFKFWIHWNMEYCNKLITLIFCSTFISYSTVISYSTFYCSKILDNLQLPFERRGHFEFRSKFIFCVQWINYLMNICIRWTKLYWEKFEYNINLKYMKVPYLLCAIYIPIYIVQVYIVLTFTRYIMKYTLFKMPGKV